MVYEFEGTTRMSLDDVFIGFIVGGIGISGAYVRAEYIRWREQGTADRSRETGQRDLHAASFLAQQNRARNADLIRQLQSFDQTDPETETERGYTFVERRKHPRERDSMSA
jgi:hypothetical protein